MEEALRDLWMAVRSDIPFNPEAGIVKYWLEHWKELGSPVGLEHDGGDGNIYQAFTQAIVRWTPEGAEVI